MYHIVRNNLKNQQKAEKQKVVVDKESHTIKIKQSKNDKNKESKK
jgi:hypothetical protein